MRKAVVVRPGVVEMRDVPRPVPRPHEVLVRIERYSPYGTDVEIVHVTSNRYLASEYPIGIGADFSGVIEEVGSSVTGWEPGTPVAALALRHCGRCRHCLSGRTNRCVGTEDTFSGRQEAAQEYTTVPTNRLAVLPLGVGFDDGAMLSGLVTTLNGFELAGATAHERCVVLGLGAMGHGAIAIGKAMGCDVIGVGIGKVRSEIARRLGCEDVVTIAGRDIEVSKQIAELVPDGPDLIIETTASEWGLREALAASGLGTRIVVLGGGSVQLTGWDLVAKELQLIGVRAGAGQAKVLASIERGEIDLKPTITYRCGLEDVPELFSNILIGEAVENQGRIMVEIGSA